jgi:hypothetical protein
MLVGHPMNDDDGVWFSHGPIFGDANSILGITQQELNQSMIRYLNKEYPEVKIGRIL